MKFRTLILMTAILVAATALCQPKRMTPQERADQMEQQLSLTGEQKAKVLSLLTEEEKNRPKRPFGDIGDRETMRAAMEKRRDEHMAKMKAILTPDQLAKYEKTRPGMRR